MKIELGEEGNIIVYSRGAKIKYSKNCFNKEPMYKKLIKIKHKVLKFKLNREKLKVKVLAFIMNPFNFKIDNVKFYIDEVLYKECNLNQYDDKISKFKMIKDRNIKTFKFSMDDILKDESIINGSIRFCINVNGQEVNYKISKKEKKLKMKKLYYLPVKSIYIKDFAIHIRRAFSGAYVLVKRKKETIENTLWFKFIESKPISFILYKLGIVVSKLRRKKINLFYEKFSEKAEEGIFELCQKCTECKNSKSYFIIDKNSPDYEKIKQYKNVVKKYSLKYYWLYYSASNFISSDTPVHLSILRSNNKYLRRAMYNKKFIFLQHGITYLKCHGRNSPYIKGKEGEFDYIVVGSEKEKDVVVDMLHYDEDKILKTGLPIFSKINYKHINQNSDDIVAIMLTWKPYEEQLYHFEDSSYYQNVVEISNMLKKYIPQEKIIIIGHPKANELLKETDLGTSIWQEPISKALEKSKLLITDYSSVCYNSFYQGAGVIFYQPDLEKYEAENGKLIPNDDEYIGKRVFNIEDLENIIKDTIQNQKINLDKVRTKENEEMYKTINEFSDGKNIDRIYQELISLDLI